MISCFRFLMVALSGWIWFALQVSNAASAPVLPEFDFTRPEVVREWHAQHHIAKLGHTDEGLEIIIEGADPYFAGPARDYPGDAMLWLELRLKSEQGGPGQVFYYRDNPTEEQSVRFRVPAGGWQNVRIKLPALGSGWRFRIDPPGSGGKVVLSSLRVTPAISFSPPNWISPVPLAVGRAASKLQSGDLLLTHEARNWGGFELSVAGQRMAIGHNRLLLGYLIGEQVRWVSLNEAPQRKVRVQQQGQGVIVDLDFDDLDGAHWQFQQEFRQAPITNAIAVITRVQVSQDRSLIFLPLLTVLPGVGTFAASKGQGLFAGLEYLADEPSSSEADVKGAAAKRLVPDTLKITFPLMAIQAQERYVGMIWEIQPQISALFDSPDRTFSSGGHALALLFPGSDGAMREDGHLLPYEGVGLKANQALTARAVLVGGPGESTIPAVEQFVQLRGLPALPQTLAKGEYVQLAAGGWLNSKAREGYRFRHAVWPGFGAQPAADASVYMDWLAQETQTPALAERLASTAREALAQIPTGAYYHSAVGHVRFPVTSLVYGHVLENVKAAERTARGLLNRFEPDGRVLYRQSSGKPDYGSTHFAPDANGLTAQVVMSLLDAAVFCGDRVLIAEGLKRLRALNHFRNTVPRGAQTWECPLHTPDILASAHLVRAYTVGYELTGDTELLDQARYWAWTGVPFVYLRNPTDQSMGPYLTPPVYGATSWVAPVWMGLPVQWCGLVYADALYRFARHEPQGPWGQLADGITIGGIQVTWPLGDADRQGLLPDIFHLRDQHRDGPAINPGTVQACAIQWYDRNSFYDFQAVREWDCLIHAPGKVDSVAIANNRLRFTVHAWPAQPSHVLINGFMEMPRVKINGQTVRLDAPHQFEEGHLVLQIKGTAHLEIVKP